MDYRTSRRRFLANAVAINAARTTLRTVPSERPGAVVEVSVRRDRGNAHQFERDRFGFVGIYDGDWFMQPGFVHLLDNLAASPGAFHGVRYFGAFTAGEPERYLPEGGGRVWTSSSAPIDFSLTFDAIEALTSRGLVPFIALGFFPPAISSSPIQPPREWDRYKELIRTFLEGLAADPRFGEDAISDWWFEAWNEPNEGRFWSGSVEEYFDLYRATSEVISETGLAVRFGGPAIAYKPQASPEDGVPWMERFLRFIASEPDVQCDFISLHRKGTVGDDPPDPRRMYEAIIATADQMLAIDAGRFAGMAIINNEADEKVGFEVPYAPRVDERNASWLGTVAAIHAGLDARYVDAGYRFTGVADNANLQLVEAPFDGRRSIMTRAGDSETDLLKIPAYAFYEMVRLSGDRHGTVVSGAGHLFPETDVYHLATSDRTHIACLITRYPDPAHEHEGPRRLDYAVKDIPWGRVNVARFQIDGRLSNAYTAAGGSARNPFPVPDPEDLGNIRQAQELAVFRPIERNIPVDGGMYRETLQLAPYTTICLWITPFTEAVPESPEWLSITMQDGNVVLRWTPSREPAFYSYDVFLMTGGKPAERLSPEPLRSALWVDTAPPPGSRRYGIRAVAASGVMSPLVISDEVIVR